MRQELITALLVLIMLVVPTEQGPVIHDGASKTVAGSILGSPVLAISLTFMALLLTVLM